MKINEIFDSLQGEGKYSGMPCVFVRLSGCTRQCDFCDTKYHIYKQDMTIKQVCGIIKSKKKQIVVWTGGEPMLQLTQIKKCITLLPDLKHHLETNGDILPPVDLFDYVCFSPKDLMCVKKLTIWLKNTKITNYDIKIVTDIKKLNVKLIPYATMLMPLTINNNLKNIINMQRVWLYCVKNNIRFSIRQHFVVWGNKKGV